MLLTDYLTPEQIQKLYTDIDAKLRAKQSIQDQKDAITIEIDTEIGYIVNSPDFKAEKNQALQEKLWRNMFPGKYERLDEANDALATLDQDLHLLREKRDGYRLLVDYFSALK